MVKRSHPVPLLPSKLSANAPLCGYQLSLSFEQKASWSPGETMDVELLAEDDALICLVGGRVPSGSKAP